MAYAAVSHYISSHPEKKNMPSGVENYCVSMSDIRAATGGSWGIYRIRSIVHGLPSIDGPKTGGRSYKLFRPSDLFPRLRSKKSWAGGYEANLIDIIRQKGTLKSE